MTNKTRESFIQELEGHGYVIDLLCEDVYRIRGNDIIASFVEEYYIDNWYNFPRTLIADNKKSFDKWTNCPMYMPIDKAFEDVEQVLKHFEWLATKEGERHSNYYEFINDPKLPYQKCRKQ